MLDELRIVERLERQVGYYAGRGRKMAISAIRNVGWIRHRLRVHRPEASDCCDILLRTIQREIRWSMRDGQHAVAAVGWAKTDLLRSLDEMLVAMAEEVDES